jgi:hypothetical protein
MDQNPEAEDSNDFEDLSNESGEANVDPERPVDSAANRGGEPASDTTAKKESADTTDAETGQPGDTAGTQSQPAGRFVRAEAQQIVSVEDLLRQPGQVAVVYLGPNLPSEYVDRPAVERPIGMEITGDDSADAASQADLSQHAKQMLSPTLDGGPPMARPIVLVRLADDQLRRIVDEVMEATRNQDEQAVREVARKTVHDELWWRDCQERPSPATTDPLARAAKRTRMSARMTTWG